MRILIRVLLVLTIFALGAGAGYYYALNPSKNETRVAASTYVFGRAIDAQGGLVAGARVELGTQSSTTNASGQWGVNYPLAAGQTLYLYVFPEVARLTPPSGVQATLQSGNVIRFVVPSPVPTQLGAFVLTMKPTLTPIPSEPVITQTWTPTRTATRTATPSVTPPMPPIPTPTMTFITVPDDVAQAIADDARQWLGEIEDIAARRADGEITYRIGSYLELGPELTQRHTCCTPSGGVAQGWQYRVFAEAIVARNPLGQPGVISPHGPWRGWNAFAW